MSTAIFAITVKGLEQMTDIDTRSPLTLKHPTGRTSSISEFRSVVTAALIADNSSLLVENLTNAMLI
eukprot:3085455-Amphidinium_carterae.1